MTRRKTQNIFMSKKDYGMRASLLLKTVGFASLLSVTVAFAGSGFVAGLQPDRRPVGAPVIVEAPISPEQLAQFLRGVEPPPPGNVATIAGTGHWFVPLRHPGATPPYDIRGWHAASKPATAAASSAR